MQGKPAEMRVMLAKGIAAGDTQHPQEFVTLPDPRTGEPSSYLVAGGHLQELNWYKQQHSSWFVGNSVVQDGGLFLATPVDPLLVLLPVLEAARDGQNVFQDLEQLLGAVGAPAARLLLPLLGGGDLLGSVCDAKQAGGQSFYRLSDARVLAWLSLKVLRAKAAMQATAAGAFSCMDDVSLTAYAAGLLGEYLTPCWQDRLAAALDLPKDLPPAHAAHPPPDYDAQPTTDKRPRLDPKEAAKQKAADTRQAAKAAKLAKEAAGMRKLSAFFRPAAPT